MHKATTRLDSGFRRNDERVVVPAKAGTQLVIACIAVAAILAGCGFQLRGDTPMAFKSIYIASAGPSAVANEVRRSLATGPTTLANTAKEGEVALRILSEAREKSILSLSTSGTVLEFQLRLRISYQLTDGGEEPLIAPTELLLNRTVAYSDTAVIAKSLEEGLQYQDMERAAARLIVNRLAFIRRPAPQLEGGPVPKAS